MNAGRVKVKVKLEKDETYFGPGVAELLENIQELGSVKEACTSMKMSYNKGWTILNRAEKQLGYELVVRQHGGAAGGGGYLTEEGALFVKNFRQLEEKVQSYAKVQFEQIF